MGKKKPAAAAPKKAPPKAAVGMTKAQRRAMDGGQVADAPQRQAPPKTIPKAMPWDTNVQPRSLASQLAVDRALMQWQEVVRRANFRLLHRQYAQAGLDYLVAAETAADPRCAVPFRRAVRRRVRRHEQRWTTAAIIAAVDAKCAREGVVDPERSTLVAFTLSQAARLRKEDPKTPLTDETLALAISLATKKLKTRGDLPKARSTRAKAGGEATANEAETVEREALLRRIAEKRAAHNIDVGIMAAMDELPRVSDFPAQTAYSFVPDLLDLDTERDTYVPHRLMSCALSCFQAAARQHPAADRKDLDAILNRADHAINEHGSITQNYPVEEIPIAARLGQQVREADRDPDVRTTPAPLPPGWTFLTDNTDPRTASYPMTGFPPPLHNALVRLKMAPIELAAADKAPVVSTPVEILRPQAVSAFAGNYAAPEVFLCDWGSFDGECAEEVRASVNPIGLNRLLKVGLFPRKPFASAVSMRKRAAECDSSDDGEGAVYPKMSEAAMEELPLARVGFTLATEDVEHTQRAKITAGAAAVRKFMTGGPEAAESALRACEATLRMENIYWRDLHAVGRWSGRKTKPSPYHREGMMDMVTTRLPPGSDPAIVQERLNGVRPTVPSPHDPLEEVTHLYERNLMCTRVSHLARAVATMTTTIAASGAKAVTLPAQVSEAYFGCGRCDRPFIGNAHQLCDRCRTLFVCGLCSTEMIAAVAEHRRGETDNTAADAPVAAQDPNGTSHQKTEWGGGSADATQESYCRPALLASDIDVPALALRPGERVLCALCDGKCPEAQLRRAVLRTAHVKRRDIDKALVPVPPDPALAPKKKTPFKFKF